jgi:hypothetical protein
VGDVAGDYANVPLTLVNAIGTRGDWFLFREIIADFYQRPLANFDAHPADTLCQVRRTGYATVVSDTAVLVIDMFNAYSHDDDEPLATNVAKIISPLSADRSGPRSRRHRSDLCQ